MKTCKRCGVPLVLTDGPNYKKESNVSPSEYNKSNPRCKKCVSEFNKEQVKKRDPSEKNKWKELYKQKELQKPLIRTKLESVTLKTEWNEQYIAPKERIFTESVAYQSAMGTNKTQIAIDYIKSNPNKIVVYISPSIALLKETEKRFNKNGIRTYMYGDTVNVSFIHQNKQTLLITPDSFHKIQDPESIDFLVIDEAYTIMSEMASKTEQSNLNKLDKEIYYNNYGKILNKKVVLLDAIIPDALMDMFSIKEKYVNSYRKTKVINFFEGQDNKYLEERFIIRALGGIIEAQKNNQSVVFQSDNLKTLQKVQTRLNEVGIRNRLVTADTQREKYLSPDEIQSFDGFGVALISPVIKVGVSLKADKVFIYSCGQSVSPYGLFQMVDRARDSSVIEIAVKRGQDFKHKTLIEAIAPLSGDKHNLVPFIQSERELRKENLSFIKHCLSYNYDIVDVNTEIKKVENLLNEYRATRDENVIFTILSYVSKSPAKDELIKSIDLYWVLNSGLFDRDRFREMVS